MHVVILGANGQLGRLLVQTAPGHVKVSAFSSSVCDISNPASVARVMDKVRPDLVINAAAYTQVDKAESEAERAWAVNHQGVCHIIESTSPTTRLLHVSTDFVFDGTAREPYPTTAPTAPLGVYGASKLAGEEALLALAPTRSCIVRTAWLYAAQGKNFCNTMLQLMATRDALNVVHDQVGTPTSALGLAEVLWRFADQPGLNGIYHWTDQGQASWYEFACEIQRQGFASGLLTHTIPIAPITTSQYPTPARRPAYSVLDKHTTHAALQFTGVSWQAALARELAFKSPQES